MSNPRKHKDLLLAILFSSLIIFGWQYFFVKPELKNQNPQEPAQVGQVGQVGNAGQVGNGTQPANQNQGAVPSLAPSLGTLIDREEALKANPRIAIKTAYVEGSVNLTGARLDDLRLKNYHETIDPQSPTIILLSPSKAPGGYFAEQGLIPASGTQAKLPNNETLWKASAGAVLTETTPLVLTWDNGEGAIFSREISIKDEYLFTIKQTVENKGQTPLNLLPYARVQRQGTPKVAGIWVFFEGMLGFQGDKLQEVHYKDVVGGAEPLSYDSQGGWLGFTDKYWAGTLIPNQSLAIKSKFQHQKQGDWEAYQADYTGRDPIIIGQGATATYQDQFFAGAKVVKLIQKIGEENNISRFDLMIDWGYFVFITKPMFYLLEIIKSFVGNFGIAILVTTVLIKLLVFPLANKSYASMSKMKNLQPQMQKLKELYPTDKAKQQAGMMELYKREKVSPQSGCLPILVQIPVFFSLYKVIYTSIELRHAPFFGWIQDLSAPDPTNLFTLFGLIPWQAPLWLHLGIWPLLMGVTMWMQMRLNPTPPDPVQASLFNWMPVIFTYMMAAFPAGLIIYWTWSNLLSILQQAFIMKRHGTEINFFGNIKTSFSRAKPQNPSDEKS